MIRALVFDLDDTLYPEREFVKSGCRAVARYASGLCGIDWTQIFGAMMRTFVAHGRARIMPLVADIFLRGAVPPENLVEIYRRHEPEINLFPEYSAHLRSLAQTYRLGIITDGLPSVQRLKVRALGLESLVNEIIFTREYGIEKEKPHPFSFCLMLERLDANPEEALFVGDNPEKDGKGAQGVGMPFVLVQRGEPVDAPPCADSPVQADHNVVDLNHLIHLLKVLN